MVRVNHFSVLRSIWVNFARFHYARVLGISDCVFVYFYVLNFVLSMAILGL